MCAKSEVELELLERIRRDLSTELRTRYEALMALRRKELLTPDDYEELQHLTDHVENLEVERVAALAELARLRQVSIDDLLAQLGIQHPTYE